MTSNATYAQLAGAAYDPAVIKGARLELNFKERKTCNQWGW